MRVRTCAFPFVPCWGTTICTRAAVTRLRPCCVRAAFTLGARDAIAISAVLASQFGVLAAVAAYVLFGERLSRRQTAGVAAIAVGVAALTLIQA